MKLLKLVAAGLALGLAGCATHSYCMQKQPYDHVPSVPEITSTGDLEVPHSATALRVPPLAEGTEDVPFGRRVTTPKGRTRIECLDEPPSMPTDASATVGAPQ